MPPLTDLLILPPSVSRSREADAKVHLCLECGSKFPLGQEGKYTRHVRDCAKANDDRAQADIASHRANPLGNVSDPEAFAWLKSGRT